MCVDIPLTAPFKARICLLLGLISQGQDPLLSSLQAPEAAGAKVRTGSSYLHTFVSPALAGGGKATDSTVFV